MDPGAMEWYYIDRSSAEFGPFRADRMRSWYAQGCFPMGTDLLVRLGEWKRHVPVRALFPGEPFAGPPLRLPPEQLGLAEASRPPPGHYLPPPQQQSPWHLEGRSRSRSRSRQGQAPGYGAPPPSYGGPGAPPHGQSAPPPPPSGPPNAHSGPPPAYGAPSHSYGAPSPGYGAPPPGYGPPPPGYGSPPPPPPPPPHALASDRSPHVGYGAPPYAPPPGYGGSPPAFNHSTPPSYGIHGAGPPGYRPYGPPPSYGAPPPAYGAPPLGYGALPQRSDPGRGRPNERTQRSPKGRNDAKQSKKAKAKAKQAAKQKEDNSGAESAEGSAAEEDAGQGKEGKELTAVEKSNIKEAEAKALRDANPEPTREQKPLELLRDRGGDWIEAVADTHLRSWMFIRDEAAVTYQDFNDLRDKMPWREFKAGGNAVTRKTLWLTRKGCNCPYTYGKDRVESTAMEPWFEDMMRRWLVVMNFKDDDDGINRFPDSVNLNLYDGGQHSVAWHSDDEPLFCGKIQDTRIVSVSLGNSRKFQVGLRAPRRGGILKPEKGSIKNFNLAHGQICTMEGLFQKHFLHQIPKGTGNKQRINATFRWIARHVPECPKSTPEDRAYFANIKGAGKGRGKGGSKGGGQSGGAGHGGFGNWGYASW
eukprot:gnl/TRDRNA2_/TRDRNA2_55164_c0_seq2.p1 gnl/TRDRNA2_/TRDRNA2_55164_c0~~gnl/TRDRNA2_/TRDRNA2_55164_c0_seq2.p1  ORF type:complete len:643 (+),score=104.07 gnl/TRDRNA2_/TRDRNA2_55164_c0_seq2:83-2011(+)